MENYIQQILGGQTIGIQSRRQGMTPEQYWDSLHPQAQQSHISMFMNGQQGREQRQDLRNTFTPSDVAAAQITQADLDAKYAQEQREGVNGMGALGLPTQADLDAKYAQEQREGVNGMGALGLTIPDDADARNWQEADRAMGALSATEGDRPEFPNGPPPALQDPNAPSPSAPPILSSGGGGGGMGGGGGSSVSARRPTGNARGSSMPYAKIGMGESLLRMGLAGMAGADQGMGATMGAMGQVYGGIQDSNRATDIKAAEVAEARRIADARVAASRAGGSGGGSGGSGSELNLSSQMFSYQSALDAIRDSRASGGNLTGVGGIFKGWLDNFTGDADAARRLILNKVKVDDALLRVADTKGAISNAEMKLFLAPAPTNLMDEAIWEAWIIDRMTALDRVQARVDSGAQVPLSERPGRSGSDTGFNPSDYTVEEISQ